MKKKDKDKDYFVELEKKLQEKKEKLDELNQKKKKLNELKKFSKKMNSKDPRKKNNIFILLLSIGLILSVILLFGRADNNKAAVATYSEFVDLVKDNKIDNNSISILQGREVNRIIYESDGIKYSVQAPVDLSSLNLFSLLEGNDVQYTFKKENEIKIWTIIGSILPWLIFFALIFFLFSPFRSKGGRGGGGGLGGAFSMGKSKAQIIKPQDVTVSFKDVKGCNEAVEEVKDIVDFLKSPSKFREIGAKIPKGILLVGQPGTGKTLLAKAVAGEAGVPFFFISGSDFVEMFVGVGASRVRDLFANAKKESPCIIFVDEIDAVGRKRGVGYNGGNDEKEQTLNQLLVEMDSFSMREGIVVLGATNRADVLDKALLRPGRFDRHVHVGIPDYKGRKEILGVHLAKIKYSKKVDVDAVAKSTTGFTGADLANLVNESALRAIKEGRKQVETKDLEFAKDKLMLGPERKSMTLAKRERENTAYHEAGHALVSLVLPEGNRLHKVTIVPRGGALGVTHYLEEEGVYTKSRKSLERELRVLYGGRVAEEIIFGDVTNGAVNDIERATKIAQAMVCDWGLSKLGPISYGNYKSSINPMFQEEGSNDIISDETAKKINLEIFNILDAAYKDTKVILKKNISKLKLLAKALMEKETLEIEAVCKLLKIDLKKIKAA